MHNYFNDDCGCEICGHRELTVKHTYLLTSSYVFWLPCTCGSTEDGVAAQEVYKMTQVREELGYLADGHAKFFDRYAVDRLPVENGTLLVYCQDCLGVASEIDWRTEEVGEGEIEEGPDAWMMFCKRCNSEIQFGWTESDREGLMIPLSKLNDDATNIWIDPGFQHRNAFQRS